MTKKRNIPAIQEQAERVLHPLAQWSHKCHEASLVLVNAGIGDRVARGWCAGVPGQHSWVVEGGCYDPTLIIDPTLWSYNPKVKGIAAFDKSSLHHPHGEGSIWDWGKPTPGKGPAVALKPGKKLSGEAESFLNLLGPLDMEGWMILASKAPVRGWPAADIIDAMCNTPGMAALVPIDRIGMLTDRNPGGLYLPGKKKR